jgi:hypothetical protein
MSNIFTFTEEHGETLACRREFSVVRDFERPRLAERKPIEDLDVEKENAEFLGYHRDMICFYKLVDTVDEAPMFTDTVRADPYSRYWRGWRLDRWLWENDL